MMADKYANRYANPNTVNNLLYTINSISRRCQNQNNTDNVLERVRSIILLYRPHLQYRSDLQVPELVMEALMPRTSGANSHQITHNYNYKYDYNSNQYAPPPPVLPPPPTDAFGMPLNDASAPPPAPPPPPAAAAAASSSTRSPAPTSLQQNVYIQPTATTSADKSPPSSPPAPNTRMLVETQRDDRSVIAQELAKLSRNNNLSSYKRLVYTMLTVSRKYFKRDDIFLQGLDVLYSVDTLMKNDLAVLIDCINREAPLNLKYEDVDLCQWLVMIVRGFYMLVSLVLKRQYNLLHVTTLQTLELEMVSIKSNAEELFQQMASNETEKYRNMMERERYESNALREQVRQLDLQLKQKERQINDSEMIAMVNSNDFSRDFANEQSLKNKAKLLEGELEQSRDRNVKNEIATQKLQQMVKGLENDLIENNNQLTINGIALRKAEDRVRVLEAELNDRLAGAKDQSTKIKNEQQKELERQIEYLKDQLVSRDNKLLIKDESLQMAEQKIETLQIKLNSGKVKRENPDDYQEQIESLQRQLASSEQKFVALQTPIDDRDNLQIEQMRSENEALVEANRQLRARLDSELRSKSTKKSTVGVPNKQTDDRIAGLRSQLKKLESKYDQTATMLAKANEDVKAKSDEINVLKNNNEQLSRQVVTCTTQETVCNEVRTDIERVKSEFAQFVESSDSIQFDILKLNNMSDQNLRNKMEQLQNANSETSDANVKQQAEMMINTLNARLFKSEENVIKLKKKMADIQSDINKYKNAYELLARATSRDILEREKTYTVSNETDISSTTTNPTNPNNDTNDNNNFDNKLI
uniref:Desmoplakin n=1 Tax=Lymantria dispar multicapsid nuclear polyhedrosis virus TaxID=10449 RepID=A0A1B1MQW2_NPVLD|nr:desmoplakin [Lymantria dispar multiple nucleopolyhedrovirus]